MFPLTPLNHTGGQSLATHRQSPASIPGQSVWDLWWTE